MQSYWPRRATYSDSSTTTSRRAWRRPFSPICLLEVEAAAAVEDLVADTAPLQGRRRVVQHGTTSHLRAYLFGPDSRDRRHVV